MPKLKPTKKYQVLINGLRPFALTRRDMVRLYPSPKVIQRLLHDAKHSTARPWLRVIQEGRPGREVLVEVESFERACERMRHGEKPPLLPSEIKRAAQRQQNVGTENE